MKKRNQKFDEIFEVAYTTRKLTEDRFKEERRHMFAEIGWYLAEVITKKGGGHELFEMSKALEDYHIDRSRSISRAEIIRHVLTQMHRMFPPGQRRLETIGNKLVKGKPWPNISVKWVLANLKSSNINMDKHNLPSIREEIRRQAKILGYTIDSVRGRPSKSPTILNHKL